MAGKVDKEITRELDRLRLGSMSEDIVKGGKCPLTHMTSLSRPFFPSIDRRVFRTCVGCNIHVEPEGDGDPLPASQLAILSAESDDWSG